MQSELPLPGAVDVICYSPNDHILDLALDKTAAAVGALHLEGLVRYIGEQVDELRRRGHRVDLVWAMRFARPQMKRVSDFVRCAWERGEVWPDGRLLELAKESDRIVHEASANVQRLMRAN